MRRDLSVIKTISNIFSSSSLRLGDYVRKLDCLSTCITGRKSAATATAAVWGRQPVCQLDRDGQFGSSTKGCPGVHGNWIAQVRRRTGTCRMLGGRMN